MNLWYNIVAMPKEIEIKFKIKSPKVIKKRLKKIGAEKISSTFEKDTYYILPYNRKIPHTIRLRTIKKEGIFTVKYPVLKNKSKKYKILNELETPVKDVDLFGRMLKKIGFKPSFFKEKLRETYKFKKTLITIDKLPHIGFYLEIEGAKNKIKKISKLLKLNPKEAQVSTYMDIFNEYKKEHNKPNIRFIF
jgi:predicted adenylyl cyclase CyaB